MIKKLTQLPIKKRNLVGFFSVILLLIILSCVSLFSLDVLSRNTQSMYDQSFAADHYSWVIKNGFNTLEKEMYKIVVNNSSSSILQTTADLLNAIQNLYTIHKSTDVIYLAQLEDLQTYLNELKTLHQDILNASLASDTETALSILQTHYASTISKAHTVATNLTDYAEASAQSKLQHNLLLKNIVFIFTICMTLISILLGLYISFVITKSIIEPLDTFKLCLSQFAKGHLNITIPYKSNDEIGQLATCLEESTSTLKGYIEDISNTLSLLANGHMDIQIASHYKGDFKTIEHSILHIAHSLNTTLHQIHLATHDVSENALHVLEGSKSLATQNIHQKELITQLFKVIDDVSIKSNENTLSAHSLYDLSLELTSFIENNSEKISALAHTMDAIKNSTSDIKQIIEVIDGIASESHLLSLNATIESARIGNQGSAFNIIAREMHELSIKSASAVKESTSLIETSINTTLKGNEIVQQTIDLLNLLITKIHSTLSPITSITLSSKDQALILTHMEEDIKEVSTITMDVAEFASRSAILSENLATKSQELNLLLSQFTFNVE